MVEHQDSNHDDETVSLFVNGTSYGTILPNGLRRRATTTKRSLNARKDSIKRVWKLFIAVIFLLCSVYFSCVLQVLTEKRAKARFAIIPDKYNITQSDRDKLLTLPDIGFDLIPFHGYSDVADYWVILMTVTTLLRFSITTMRATILRRWAMIVGVLFVLRGISIYVTILPAPDHSCRSGVDTDRVFYSAFLALTLQTRTCADVLFSGHSVNGTACALLWTEYSDVVPLSIPRQLCRVYQRRRFCSVSIVLIWFFSVCGYLLIIATHFHYTVDVIFAVSLTLLVWRLYHNYVYGKVAPLQSSTVAWEGVPYLQRFMFYLEQDAEDVEYYMMLDVLEPSDNYASGSEDFDAGETGVSRRYTRDSQSRISISSRRDSLEEFRNDQLAATLLDSPGAYQSFSDL